jgi:hypothetical protein
MLKGILEALALLPLRVAASGLLLKLQKCFAIARVVELRRGRRLCRPKKS